MIPAFPPVPAHASRLLEALPDVVFYTKDRSGAYTSVSPTIASRCGLASPDLALGRDPRDLFPGPHGERYRRQDLRVLQQGRPLRNVLQLHPYPGQTLGWGLTSKEPLFDAEGRVVGLAGLSRDLGELDSEASVCRALAAAITFMEHNATDPIRMEALAARVSMSLARLERAMRRILGLTPIQYLGQVRMERAVDLLQQTDDSIAKIASRCGYVSHSSFTRQFRATVGAPPSAFRAARSVQRVELTRRSDR